MICQIPKSELDFLNTMGSIVLNKDMLCGLLQYEFLSEIDSVVGVLTTYIKSRVFCREEECLCLFEVNKPLNLTNASGTQQMKTNKGEFIYLVLLKEVVDELSLTSV